MVEFELFAFILLAIIGAIWVGLAVAVFMDVKKKRVNTGFWTFLTLITGPAGAMSYWVYQDGFDRPNNEIVWGIITFFLGPIAIAFYLTYRIDPEW